MSTQLLWTLAASRTPAPTLYKAVDSSVIEMAEILPGLAFVADPSGAVLHASSNVQEITGFAASDLRGGGWLAMLHPDDRDRALLTWRVSLEAGEPFMAEYRIHARGGEFRWHLCRCRPVRVAGQVVQWVGSYVEVANRHPVSESPDPGSGRSVWSTFDHAASGIAYLSPGGCVLAVNDRVCEILARSRDELLDRAFQAATHPEDLPATVELLQNLLSGRLTHSRIDKRYVRPDGSVVWARVNAALVRTEDGDPDHLVLVLDDITREKEEEARERRLAARAAFLRRLEERMRIASTPRMAVNEACELIGRELDLDLCAWREVQTDNDHTVISSEWRTERIDSALGRRAVPCFGAARSCILETGKPMCIADASDMAEGIGCGDLRHLGRHGARGALEVPISVGGELKAALVALSSRPRQWSEEEIAFLRELAQLVWQAAERAQAEDALRASERRFRAVFENAGVGIGQVELPGQMSTVVNSTLCRMLGYSQEEMLATHWSQITHADDIDKDRELSQRLAAGEIDSFTLEKRYIHKDGHVVWGRLTLSMVRDEHGAPEFEIGVVQDITEQKIAEAKLRQFANDAHQASRTDGLTGLPNRNAFNDWLSQAARAGERVVLFIDVNGFKRVNDSLGHEAGDLLIGSLAQRLNGLAARDRVLARIGGDEFIFVITGPGAGDRVRDLCQRIQGVMEGPLVIKGHSIHVRLAMGYAVQTSDDMAAGDLIRQADLAMYEAKRQRHGGAVGFGDLIERSLAEAAALEEGLRRAIHRDDEISVVYQPIVSRNGRMVRAEALARWQSPELGSVPPDRFIKVAEGAGLMVELGRKLIRIIVSDLIARPDLHVSINVSSVQLTTPDFVPSLLAEAGARNIDPGRIEIELTESVVVEDADLVATRIQEIRSAGFSTALDDFGTGYSSLGYLQRIRFDTLKIDRSFVTGFDDVPQRTALLDALIAMAHSLGLNVVCEGVETESERAMLLELGCDLLQGYHLGRPVPLADLSPVDGAASLKTTPREASWPAAGPTLDSKSAMC